MSGGALRSPLWVACLSFLLSLCWRYSFFTLRPFPPRPMVFPVFFFVLQASLSNLGVPLFCNPLYPRLGCSKLRICDIFDHCFSFFYPPFLVVVEWTPLKTHRFYEQLTDSECTDNMGFAPSRFAYFFTQKSDRWDMSLGRWVTGLLFFPKFVFPKIRVFFRHYSSFFPNGSCFLHELSF